LQAVIPKKMDDKVGKEFWFEYHCLDSPTSIDSELWYRSYQKVKVTGSDDVLRSDVINGLG
jgi:hypothetical protein